MGYPACNPGFLWEELRFVLPWASADDAVTVGGAAKGGSGGQAALSAGYPCTSSSRSWTFSSGK